MRRITTFASILLMLLSSAQGLLAATALNETEIENLVAPVALYPDPLLDQVLDASQYPSDLVEAGDYLSDPKNKSKDPKWPASVQALLDYPEVLSKLDDDLAWTTRLGNAEKAQKADVEKAVQIVRKKAQHAGNLTSTDKLTVVVVKDTIEIVPADPKGPAKNKFPFSVVEAPGWQGARSEEYLDI